MLAQSSQTAVRQAHERELLNRYVVGLKNLGVEYPHQGQALWEDYRLTHLYNWIYVAVVSGALDASDERAFAWMSKMVQRQVATTQDLDLLNLLANQGT